MICKETRREPKKEGGGGGEGEGGRGGGVRGRGRGRGGGGKFRDKEISENIMRRRE